MVQHTKQQPTPIVLNNQESESAIETASFGSGVFTWTIKAIVRQDEATPGQWSVTLQVIAQGGDNTRQIFLSGIGYTKLGSTAQVPFPISYNDPIFKDSYGMAFMSAQYRDGEAIISQTIGVYLRETPAGIAVSIVNTEITPIWIIGARDISLIDDEPLYNNDKVLLVGREEESIVG